MPAPGTQLYFIALIPPSPYYEEAQRLKESFRDKYQSKGALKSPPHITLHMPFEWKEKKENALVENLHRFAHSQKQFYLTLSGFSCFEPRVIFIDVVANNYLNLLEQELHKFCKINLNIFNARYQDLPFHPHLTIAFRDLKKSSFITAWKEFEHKSFSAVFNVNRISLLKHDGIKWNAFQEFHFLD